MKVRAVVFDLGETPLRFRPFRPMVGAASAGLLPILETEFSRLHAPGAREMMMSLIEVSARLSGR